jgi:hypothetical protein
MIRASMVAVALLAAACTPPAEEPESAPEPVEPAAVAPATREEATAQDACGAAQYASLVGSNIAAVTLPTGSHRVIAPDTMVTMDFSATRLNIITNAEGVITELACY